MTVADTIFDTINDNWGNGGYGGDRPAIDTTEEQVIVDHLAVDTVTVMFESEKEDPRRVNDKFKNRYFLIDIHITSTDTAAQLKLIMDETEYLLENTTMTGLKVWNIKKAYFRPSQMAKYGVIFTVELFTLMSDGAITPSTSTPTDLAIGGDLTVAGAAEITGVTTFVDETMTSTQVADGSMIGSANAAYIPCQFWIGSEPTKIRSFSDYLTNVDGTDSTLTFDLPISTVKDSLGLHLDILQVGIRDADVANYLTGVIVFGQSDHDSRTEILNDATDYTAPATVPYNIGDTDCSGYVGIKVNISLFCTGAGLVDITFVRLRCWYE